MIVFIRYISILYIITLSLSSAQNQAEINEKSFKDFQNADEKLNSVYKKLMASLDESGKEKLILSERDWLSYRDAEAGLEADLVGKGGTITASIYNESRVNLTELRTNELAKIISLNNL